MSGKRTALLLSAFVGSLQVGGCAPLTFEVPVALTGGSGSFDVQAGVPAQKSGSFVFNPGSFDAGSGSLALSADDVKITPASSGSGKVISTAQQVVTCMDACIAADVDGDTCDQVCNSSTLQVTIRIASVDNAERVCEEGTADADIPRDTYGPYLLELDENGEVVSVTPSSIAFGELTVSLLNEGEFTVCIDIISPIDASITIQNLVFNVGL